MVVDEAKWFSLEKAYFGVAKAFFGDPLPPRFEIHAQDLKSGRGVFRGFSLAQQLSFRDAMLHLLVANGIPVIYRRIIKNRFKTFCEDNYGPGIRVNPYVMALPFVCMEVDYYLRRKGAGELGMLIFDEQKENLNDAEVSLRTLRLDSNSALKTSNLVEKGFFVDSAKSFGLQLIDLAAYYIRKFEENKLGVKVSDYDKQTFEDIEQITHTGVGSKVVDVIEWVRSKYIK